MSNLSSRKQAMFEAWLVDGVYLEEDGSYRVLSSEEAKQKIHDLISKEDYKTAKQLAELLKNKISFSTEKISKSIRVSFQVYAKLAEIAFREQTTFNALINNFIIKDVEKLLEKLSTRKDILPERANELRETLDAWKKSLLPDGTERHTLGFKIDGKPVEVPKETVTDTYSPSIYLLPNLSKDIAKLCVDRWLEEVKNQCSSLPPEALEKYLEKTCVEKMPEELVDNPQLISIKLRSKKNGKLNISVEYLDYLVPEMSDDELFAFEDEMMKEFGSNIVNKFAEIHENFFLPEGANFEVELFSGELELKGKQLLIDGIMIPSEKKAFEEAKAKLLSKYDPIHKKFKAKLNDALEKGMFDKVVELSDVLARLKWHKKLAGFSLDILFNLLNGKTQVLSFRAPELIVRAWEAYGDTELNSIFTLEA